MRYQVQEVKVYNLLGSTLMNGSFDFTALDLETNENDAMAVLNTGPIASTSAVYAVNIQASTTSTGTFSTIASFNVFSGTASSNKISAIPVSIERAGRKWIRASVTVTPGSGLTTAQLSVTLSVRPTKLTASLNSATLA